MPRYPARAASNLLLGVTATSAAFAATVGAQEPIAGAGLAVLATGAGYASRLLAVDEERGVSAYLGDEADHWLSEFTAQESAALAARDAAERAADLAALDFADADDGGNIW